MQRRDLLAGLPAVASRHGRAVSLRPRPRCELGAALPDPPFEFMIEPARTGSTSNSCGLSPGTSAGNGNWFPFKGADFNGIFAGLDTGAYDCVASGTDHPRP